ncbi:cGMP-inhibited 3',5'-cyclic phosphodiesterase 3A-like isoform X3 [Paramacrobiotus metropolitanus]|uniref:cGMP-inhibited 3',5'-cyclic phosphodiesterase 3A-like isoform X3 n=1 Tax=Paramacrobiotus metropolitanus TaxID=2943436 RepID=UPI0024461288|nr:cGMP-inhibited 3',5'-cyclic phosphodiesterase 3A-like isoform X3 [Paramacrobiotus metropolitanus]
MPRPTFFNDMIRSFSLQLREDVETPEKQLELSKGGSPVNPHSSGSMPSYEAAVIAEAHGIITDMLADGTLLPPHIASGLRAVASLLEQPGIGTPSSASARQKNGPFVSLSEVCSDTEESPFTGERPNVLPKRFRRSLPLSLLRRMSTSTWTTTTSATGLPTLEPEPSRKRSTSFRTSPVSSPGGSRSQSPSPACSPNPSADVIVPKQRSLSTIIPSRGSPVTAPINRKYHRSTIGSISVPEGVLSKSVTFNLEPTNLRTDAHVLSEESRPAEKIHLSPAIRRINLTSDYESSESPSNSEHDESAALLDELAAQNAAPAADESALVPEEGSEVEEEDLIPGRHYRVGNITYDLEVIDEHPLLNHLSEWDFPVFDLYNEMGDRILSQVAYKIFQDVGLFDTFKIPVQEFLNYFHTLEMGYRDKPYHNRIHAADVLHGVYFLSSQPIPGFIQIPWHDTPKVPKTRPNSADVSAGDALPNLRLQYANGSAENDIYGIMGCNLPPLELMALYAAAAMHDYDHPGRTNAFLVATNAPQAVLYNDRSVLENHHAAAAWRLLLCKPEFNWLCHLEKAEWKRFRYLVIEAVLATDLKRHFEIIAEFNSKASDDDAPGLDWTNETDRLMACQMCIKLADINGPCKRKDLHLQWTYRITEEFFEQGDEEASLGLPISPYMDRNNPQLARLQESFINHLVAPLCNAYGEAGLLPGRWRILDEPEDRSSDSSRKTSLETGGQIPEDSVSEDPLPLTERVPLPRIECLLTEHLKSNHEMWVIKVKEEERLKAEKADWDSKNSSRKNSAEEP